MSALLPHLDLIALSLVLSFLLCKLIILVSQRLHFLRKDPTADRWHKKATPSFGGIAIFVSFALATVFAGPLEHLDWVFLLGCSAMFLLGLFDDLRPTEAYVKLLLQIVIALLVAFNGIHMTVTQSPLIYYPLTVLWMVAITNTFNLIDNMDGLAAGIGVIALICLLFISGVSLPLIPPKLILPLLGALLGFLILNYSPAKIFMGDCGSLFLGFALANMAILDTWKSASHLILLTLIPLTLFAVPIFDTVFVSFARKLNGLPITLGGQDHTSHRLVRLGLSERSAVLFLWATSGLFGCIAILSAIFDLHTWGLLVSLGLAIIVFLSLVLREPRIYNNQSSALHLPRLRTNVFFKRRILEVIFDAQLLGMAYVAAFFLRYDGYLDAYHEEKLLESLPYILATKLLVLLATGSYRGLFMYLNFKTAQRLVQANVLASLSAVLVILLLYRFEGFSRSLFAIDFVISLLFILGARSLLRWLKEALKPDHPMIRLAYIGEESLYTHLVKQIQEHPEWNLSLVAQFTSELTCPLSQLENHLRSREIDQVLLGHSTAQHEKWEQVRQLCRKFNTPAHEVRPMTDVLLRKLHFFEEH